MLSLSCFLVFGKASFSSLAEACFSCVSDGMASTFVFVIWGHISDALVVMVLLGSARLSSSGRGFVQVKSLQ